MKNFLFFFLILLIFISSYAQENQKIEKYIQIEGMFYKIILDENGDTISKEPLEIEKSNIETPVQPLETILQEREYNPQLLKIIPYKWQAGWYGAWQGWAYGSFLVEGLGLTDSKVAPLIVLSTPTLMFFLPPLLIKDDVPIRSLAFIDWGYRLGPTDFYLIKNALSNDQFATKKIGRFDPDNLGLIATGYTESWLGYYLSRKNNNLRRAASDFYGAGAFHGYITGALIGIYLTDKLVDPDPEPLDSLDLTDSIKVKEYEDSLQVLNNKRELLGQSITLLTSLGFRTLGFYLGNSESFKFKSFDGYFYTFNMTSGILIATEIYNYIDRKDEFPLVASVFGMASSFFTYYLMRDIHLDDGNAILMIIGGVVGGALGQAIERTVAAYSNNETKIHTSIGAACMILGEYLVFKLRKESILSGNDIIKNTGFLIYPTKDNGFKTEISIRF